MFSSGINVPAIAFAQQEGQPRKLITPKVILWDISRLKVIDSSLGLAFLRLDAPVTAHGEGQAAVRGQKKPASSRVSSDVEKPSATSAFAGAGVPTQGYFWDAVCEFLKM